MLIKKSDKEFCFFHRDETQLFLLVFNVEKV